MIRKVVCALVALGLFVGLTANASASPLTTSKGHASFYAQQSTVISNKNPQPQWPFAAAAVAARAAVSAGQRVARTSWVQNATAGFVSGIAAALAVGARQNSVMPSAGSNADVLFDYR